MRRIAMLVLALALGPSRARAQSAEDGWAPPEGEGSRPTSGEASFSSGRTLGVGETLIAAALGWPGLWAHVELAPSASMNVGIRGGVLYGAPAMGLVAGVGGELVVPVRVHLWGEGDTDVALRVAPEIALGEGRIFGESQFDLRAARLGVSSRLDLGVRIGWRVAERITFVVGADAGAGMSWVESDRVHAIGVFSGTIGIEALMSRDTLLFAEAQAGAGIAEAGDRAIAYYPQQEVFRLALGLGYLL